VRELGVPASLPTPAHSSIDVSRPIVDHASISPASVRRGHQSRSGYLLSQGPNGISVAFDLPTLMGYDSDHSLAEGEVGNAVSPSVRSRTWKRSSTKFRSAASPTSMTINSPAAILWAMYLAVAEKQGVDWSSVSGTLQNDILKEYIAQKEYIYPPKPSMRLVIDTFEFGARHTPKFNTISISGYHIREAGSTAIQELAFTLRDGIEYVEWGLRPAWTGRFRAAPFILLQCAQ